MEIRITDNNKKGRRLRKAMIITVSIIVVLVLILLILMPAFVMSMFLDQHYQQRQYAPTDYGIDAVQIPLGTDDNLTLAAWWVFAETEKPNGTVIILSGIQNPSVTAFFGYAKMLSDEGWDSLLIEMRARSLSEGETIGLGMTEWLDVKAGVDMLAYNERAGSLPIVVMGTSLGGGVSIIAAGELDRIDAVISISAYSNFTDLVADNMSMMGLPRFIGVIDAPFFNLYNGIRFGFSNLKYTPVNGIAKIGERPILMMHSTGDTQVPYTQFEKLLNTAQRNGIAPETFVRDGDWHFVCYDDMFEDPTTDTEFSQTILSFLTEHFEQYR